MKRTIYALLLCCLFIGAACDKYSGEFIYNPEAMNYNLYDVYVDENGISGVVVATEWNHIIILSMDESYESWGPMGELVYWNSDVTKSILNDEVFSLAVMQNMKSLGLNRFHAQAWCNRKNGSDTDPFVGSWRLPSVYEFKLIFESRYDGVYHYNGIDINRLNSVLTQNGGTPVDEDKMYWTCVEDFDDYIVLSNSTSDYDKLNRAVARSPKGMYYSNKDNWIKKNKHYVRAIKYVYFHYNEK